MDAWLEQFQTRLTQTFPDEVLFLGLQGSHARNEAGPDSDIDVVVLFRALTPDMLLRYRALLDELPHRERICGFVGGQAEVLAWDPADLFQLVQDTRPLLGSLDFLRPIVAEQAGAAARAGACAIYHACVHNLLHGQQEASLRALYKSAMFTLQALHCRDTGIYLRSHRALASQLQEPGATIAKRALELKDGAPCDLTADSAALFTWAQWAIIH